MIKRLLFLLALCLLIASVSAGPINSTTIFYAPMNGTVGTNAFTDLSVNAFPQTIMAGTPTIQQANGSYRFNNASYFAGNGRVDYSPSAANLTGDFYIGFWINSTSATTWNAVIGNEGVGGNGAGNWRIGTRTNAGNVINLICAAAEPVSAAFNVNDNVWHYIAMNRTGSTAGVGGVVNISADGVIKAQGSVATYSFGKAANNLTLGWQGVDNIYYTGYLDDVVIYNATAPVTSVPSVEYVNSAPSSATPISASFTQSPNPSSTGQSVTLTDTSTGSPTTWNWSINGIVTNTTQNAAYTFPTAGTYYINLNVTNSTGSFSNLTQAQSVINATGFTRQDIWMTAQYTLAIHVLDASDGSIIPNATMVDSGTGATHATTNGTIYATYPFQAVAGVVSATGYDAKGFSVFVDNDTSTTVQLTKATTTSQNANVVYQAQLYRFLFSNLIGTPLGGLQVTITPLNLTMQSNWTTLLMGMSPEINITNGVISGITGRDGSFGTPLINPLYYQVTITGTAQSGDIVNQIFTEYPPPVGGDILIQIPTSVTGFRTIIPQQANITYNIYNVTVNSSTSILSVNFNDPTGATNLTVVTITNQSGYVLNNTSYSGAAADNVVNNFTYTQGVTSPAGDILSYGFSAYIPGSGGWNNISQPIDFNTGTSLTGNATYDGWLSIIIIVLVASAFTYSSVYIGTIGVGLMGLFFYYTVKWFTPAVSGTVFVAACVFWICIGVIGFIAKRSRKVD